MMNLVTGGSGYFGSLLLKKLLDAGERCRVLDINDAYDRPSDVAFFKADIRDYAKVRNACDGVDIVFHNVAQVPLAKDKDLFYSVNVLGTENILKASLSAGVKKVIYTSSSAIYGVPKKNPVTEDDTPTPGENYGKAKLDGEKLCMHYANKGLDVTIIRPRTIIGHGRLGIFQILFEWIRGGYNIPVLGKGDNTYQFVHADDLASASILASKRNGFSVYNCGTDRYGTMRELLERLCDYAQTGSRVKSVPMSPAVLAMKITSALNISPLGPYHALMYGRSLYFDISKIKAELNWQPQYSNTEMLIQSYDWYLKNDDILQQTEKISHHRGPVKQGILSIVKRLI
jgi:nucleoside-diphosphate-sugar epimerase